MASHTPSSAQTVQIDTVPHDEQMAVLWEMFSWEEEAARRQRIAGYLQAARVDSGILDHLLQACCGEKRVASIWGHIFPGRLANVWPPRVDNPVASSVAESLQSELERRLTAAGVGCAQALLPIRLAAAAEFLRRRGYSVAACFLFLGCEVSRIPVAKPSTALEFEPFDQRQLARLEALIERTYVGTMDVPMLNGLREISDVVEGYRHTGSFAAERWFFVRHRGADVGCLLLTDHAGLGQWELVYMGLAPEARGHGWGVEITRFAQSVTAAAGQRGLILGVDRANHPARSMYARCGFSELEQRMVLIKKFNSQV